MTQRNPPPPSWRLSPLGAMLVITLAALFVYGKVTGFGFVNFDDDVYVEGNAHVLSGLTADNIRWSFGSSTHTYWHPLVWLSLMLDATIYGGGPTGFHATNLIIHIINAMLVFTLLHRGTGSVGKSLTVALLFAVHPVNVESVAWVVERKNVLSTFFFLLTTVLYLSYARKRSYVPYILALGCHAFGLMTKPSVMVAPGMLFLLDLWPLGRLPLQESPADIVKRSLKLILEKVPFLVLSILSFWLLTHSVADNPHVGTDTSAPLALRLENAFVGYVAYLIQAAWPFNLTCYNPFPSSIPLWQWTGALLVLLAITTLALRFIRKAPYILAGWGWYGVALLPASGLIQTGLWPATADRFAYVPLIGIFVVLAWGVPRHPKIMPWIAAGLIFALACLGRHQVSYWQNGTTLFSRVIAIHPDNAFAHTNLGNSLLREGHVEDAIAHYRESLQLSPSYPLTHNDLGVALQQQGKLDEAIACFREALRLSPDYMDAHINLGISLYRTGKGDEAIACFQRVLALDPSVTEARANLDYAQAHPVMNTTNAPISP